MKAWRSTKLPRASPVDDAQSKDKKTPRVDIEQRIVTEDAIGIAIDTIEEDYTIDSKNSPYAEVHANVSNTDDVDLPVNTVRMWVLGIVFTMVSVVCSSSGGLS